MKLEFRVGERTFGKGAGRWLALDAREKLSVDYVAKYENVADDRHKTVIVTLLVAGSTTPEVSSVSAPVKAGEDANGPPLEVIPFTAAGWRPVRVRIASKLVPHDGTLETLPVSTLDIVVYHRRVLWLAAFAALVMLTYACIRLAWIFTNPAGTFSSKCVTFATGAVPGFVLGFPIGAALVSAVLEILRKKKRDWALWFTRPDWLAGAAFVLLGAGALVPRWSTIIHNDSPATLQFTNGGKLEKATGASVLTWHLVDSAFVNRELEDPKHELCAARFVPASSAQTLRPFDCLPRITRTKRLDWPLLLYASSPGGLSVACKEARWKIGAVLAKPANLEAAEVVPDGGEWLRRTFKPDSCEVLLPTKALVDLGKALDLHLSGDEAVARLVLTEAEPRDVEPRFADVLPRRLSFRHFGPKPATADLVLQAASTPLSLESITLTPRGSEAYPSPDGRVAWSVSSASKPVGTLTCTGSKESQVHVYWGQRAAVLHLSTKGGGPTAKASSWIEDASAQTKLFAVCNDGIGRFDEGIARAGTAVELPLDDAPIEMGGDTPHVTKARCEAKPNATHQMAISVTERATTCAAMELAVAQVTAPKALEQNCCLKHGVPKVVRCTSAARSLPPSTADSNDLELARSAGCDEKSAVFRNF
jgi:hypothetical protein